MKRGTDEEAWEPGAGQSKQAGRRGTYRPKLSAESISRKDMAESRDDCTQEKIRAGGECPSHRKKEKKLSPIIEGQPKNRNTRGRVALYVAVAGEWGVKWR